MLYRGDVLGKIDFKELKNFLLSLELMLVIALSSTFILFSPEKLIKKIYLLEIRDKYGTFIGIAFILSIFVVVLRVLSVLINIIKKKYKQRKTLKALEKNLNKLNNQEKKIIKQFTETETNTLFLQMNNGNVRKLENLVIIGKAATQHMTSGFDPTFPYLLQPWVYDYLEKYPDYFD